MAYRTGSLRKPEGGNEADCTASISFISEPAAHAPVAIRTQGISIPPDCRLKPWGAGIEAKLHPARRHVVIGGHCNVFHRRMNVADEALDRRRLENRGRA